MENVKERVKIDRATVGDLEDLQQISRVTFSETFAAANTGENMKHYLEVNLSLARLRDELTNTNSEFYIASSGIRTIGYLKMNYGNAQTEPMGDGALEIERIYVLKEYYGKGVGRELYEKAVQIARERSAAYIWLGVWENNLRARRFYEKLGFAEFGKHVFRLGDDDQTDILVRFNL